MVKSRPAAFSATYPHSINPSVTSLTKRATCTFNIYPQITSLLTTTKFINTKSGE